MTEEFRAVFTSPHGQGGSRGPGRASLVQALKDRPERSEETHEYLSGVECRQVSPWIPVDLGSIVEASK